MENTFEGPSTKKDSEGNLITDLANLEKLYLDTYVERLQPNKI